MVVCLMFVVCCVGSGVSNGLITHSEESCSVHVSVCDLETSTVRQPRPDLGCVPQKKKKTAGYVMKFLLTKCSVIYWHGTA